MAKRHKVNVFLAAACLCIGMGIGVALLGHARAANENDSPTAVELLEAGEAHLEAGERSRARSALQRVDPIQLNRAERERLRRALREARGEAPEPEPEPIADPEPEPAAPPAPRQAVEGPPAEELLEVGLNRLEAGERDRARAILRRVDSAELGAGDRARLHEALAALDEPAPAEVEPEPAIVDVGPAEPRPVVEGPPAEELLDAGLRQLEAGERERARITLRRVDPAELDRENRERLRQALVRADEPAPIVEPEPPVAEVAPDEVDPDRPRGGELLELGLAQEERDERERARATLRRIDPAELTAEQREQLQEALARLDEPVPVEPDPDLPEPEPPVAVDPDESPDELMERAVRLRAQQLVAEAEEAAEQGQFNRALRLYERALGIDPENEAAIAGAETARALLDRDAPPPLAEEFEVRHRLQREQARARYEAAMDRARLARDAGDFRGAVDAANRADRILAENRRFLEDAEFQRRRQAALDFQTEVDRQIREAEVIAQMQREREVEVQQAQRRIEAERATRRQINELMLRARELQQEQRYEQAIDTLDQVLFIDPNNVGAQGMLEMIQDAMIFRNLRDVGRQRGLAIAEQSLEMTEASIPYPEIVMYPPDWPQITQTRLGAAPGLGAAAPERAVRLALREPLAAEFEAIALEDAIDYFREATGINIFVNWRALEAAGVNREDRIRRLPVDNIPAERALRMVLDEVGGEAARLGFSVDEEGIVTVSTEDGLGRDTRIVSYDINDLLIEAPTFDDAPNFDLAEITRSNKDSRRSGVTLASGAGQTADESGETMRKSRIAEIRQLIMDTVDPDNWREVGGTISSMSELNGSLIINTTAANHRALGGLLDQLRATRAVQINVESRFLLVDQNYLDEVGVGMDITIDDIGSRFSPIIIQQSQQLGIAERQPTGITGSFSDPPPAEDLQPDEPPIAAGRGLVVSGSFLSDVQVDLLVRATQAHRRATSLSAPRVTFFNGQTAFVVIATQVAFISDLNAQVGTNAVAFEPTVDTIASGVVLAVEGVVSADRRYVTLTAQPQLSNILEIQSVPFETIVPGQVVDGQQAQDRIVSAPLQLPITEFTSVATTVSVPDKGTLLLGGQRLMVDIEVEAGVPMLSKVPMINRLFTNRTTVKDERTLLILVKPTILIEAEKEAELFPGLREATRF